jgi:2-polyprenyl-3-methyl-5-hydroxy-6-metoxy-1,4-benzoquinol methylase
METTEIEKALADSKSKWGNWTAHNIELTDTVYTLGKGVRGDEFIVNRVNQIIGDWRSKPWQDLRVLDLGCLEGLYCVELAKHGAETVGVEIREANLEKAKTVKNILKLEKMHLFLDDVRNISQEKYGKFDVVLCIGILYHLDAPDVFRFIEKMSEVCTGMLIIDTHISLEARDSFHYEGSDYSGWFYQEHATGTAQSEKDKNLWASIDNEKSFWLTEPSLYNFLNRCGFSSIYECRSPVNPKQWRDRVTLVAVKGEKVPYRSSNEFSKLTLPQRAEGEAEISGAHNLPVTPSPQQVPMMTRVRRRVRKALGRK